MKEIIIEVIKVIGIALSAGLASGGVITYYIKKHDRMTEIEKKFDRLSEGMELGLENDIVIFNAFRNNHINGESEKQEAKMREYFFHKTANGLYLNKEEKK
mgnify:CR=1 FL=1